MTDTTPRAGYSTPMLHVAEVERSIRFYELLGFKLIDKEGDPIGWARMHCEGGAIMFLRAEHPIDSKPKPFLLYMYSPDLAALRNQLVAAGVNVPPIKPMPYMPSGMINFHDPDGYIIEIAQWGRDEQEAWEKRIGATA